MYNSIYDSLIIGKKVIYLPTCHSTNDIAAELVLKGLAEEGTIVITDNQFAGRGQRGSEWYSEPSKNLTFSIILKPNFLPLHEQFLISQVVAIAIFNYFSFHTNQVKIKWPNDIYILNKKVSGTLIENSIQGSTISHSIIGIGININQVNLINPQSTSLAQVIGHQVSLEAEFPKLVRFLDAGYIKLKTMRHQDTIQSEYLENLYGYNKTVRFKYQNEQIEGIVTGVTKSGRISIRFKDRKEVYEFGLKEIEWIWD